jgi:hypothetical protein
MEQREPIPNWWERRTDRRYHIRQTVAFSLATVIEIATFGLAASLHQWFEVGVGTGMILATAALAVYYAVELKRKKTK